MDKVYRAELRDLRKNRKQISAASKKSIREGKRLIQRTATNAKRECNRIVKETNRVIEHCQRTIARSISGTSKAEQKIDKRIAILEGRLS